MTLAEARSYVNGLNRRHRTSWEQTRAILMPIIKALTGSTYELDLPWLKEEGEKQEIATPEEMEALRARARAMEKLFNNETD